MEDSPDLESILADCHCGYCLPQVHRLHECPGRLCGPDVSRGGHQDGPTAHRLCSWASGRVRVFAWLRTPRPRLAASHALRVPRAGTLPSASCRARPPADALAVRPGVPVITVSGGTRTRQATFRFGFPDRLESPGSSPGLRARHGATITKGAIASGDCPPSLPRRDDEINPTSVRTPYTSLPSSTSLGPAASSIRVHPCSSVVAFDPDLLDFTPQAGTASASPPTHSTGSLPR